MRYQSWDALVFPAGSKIPIQEFKTGCHVVQDHESGSMVPSTLMLPTVTCFIPGLPTGFPFRVSVHCWDTPEISRYTQSYSKHPESVMYEARIFIDGRLSGRRLFQRSGPWPMILDTGLDRDRNGDLEELKFPNFHAELLTQNYWNAGDDLGRIKVVISEGFPRDSVTMPLERVKNVVSFSFQHAPIEVLEASNISWPNPAMWRQLPFSSAYLAQQVSPQKYYEELESHSHSPRRKNGRSLPAPPFATLRPPQYVPAVPPFPRASNHDPFYDKETKYRKASSSGDISMSDYATSNGRRVTDPSSQYEGHEARQLRNLQSAGAYEEVLEALLPAAPANTPLDGATPMAGIKTEGFSGQSFDESLEDNPDIDPVLRGHLFESEIKARREKQYDSPLLGEQHFAEGTTRKASGLYATTNNSGSKRQRVPTPPPFTEDDETDRTRGSPPPRKVSQAFIPSEIQNMR